MRRICCLAGIDKSAIPLLSAVLKASGESSPPVVTNLDVRDVGNCFPRVLIGDVDCLIVNPFEVLRQIRFILPECMIAVYSGQMTKGRGLAFHMAGVNCVLSKDATEDELSAALIGAESTGCYTDPRFVA